MKPRFGQDVYYTDALRHKRPAKITFVHHDEETVDLAVFFRDKLEFRMDVKHDQDHEPKTWDWMGEER